MTVLIPSAVAAIIAIWGVISHRAMVRRRATLDHLAGNNVDRDMLRAQKKFIELAKAPGGLAMWAEPENESRPEVEYIRLILNDFELISTSIQFGIMDFDFLKRQSAGTIQRYWRAAAPFVHALRDRIGSDSVYIEFETLNDWISQNKRPRRNIWIKKFF